MQPVGKLNQKDANVLGHRKDKFSEIFRLSGTVGMEFQPGQFGDTLNQLCDL